MVSIQEESFQLILYTQEYNNLLFKYKFTLKFI